MKKEHFVTAGLVLAALALAWIGSLAFPQLRAKVTANVPKVY